MSQPTTRQGLRGRSFWALIATQFLGAFNDNAYKMIVMLVVSAGVAASAGGAAYLAASTAVFAVAYILFSGWAGSLADRHSKGTVITWTKVAEVAAMLLAFVALWVGGRYDIAAAPILVLFLMAVQSTFFSPSKYGILPELLDDEELSQGNGILNMTTYAGIILGTAASGWLMWIGRGGSLQGSVHRAGLVLAGIAGIATVSSLFIRRVPPTGVPERAPLNPFANAWADLRRIRQDRPLFVCVLATTYLWAFGAMYVQNFVPYARESLGVETGRTISTLLGVWCLGVGLGSLLAGKLSGRKIELGMVPFGGAGMALCTAVFALIPLVRSHGVRLVLTGADLAALGLFAGFYFVPVNAFVQHRSPAGLRGKTIATLNFITWWGVLAAAFVVYSLSMPLKLDPSIICAVIALVTAAVTVSLCVALPTFFIRFVAWFATHTAYRFRAVGLGHVPKRGPALLVCNHVSLADAALIAACFQRPVRFVMYRAYYEHPLLHWAARRTGAIPISADDPPETLAASFRDARRALVESGELVCIFAEGSISRTRNLRGFGSEFEQIADGTDAPVIPVHLDRVWGSIFGYRAGRVLWRLPRALPCPVTVSFGEPMPAGSTAHEVRTAVAELAADAFEYRRGAQVLLHHAFIRAAKLHWWKRCAADPTTPRVRYGRLLTMASLLSRPIRRLAGARRYVGLMLPPSVAGAAANIAALFAGKIPVNLNYTSSEDAIDQAIARCEIETILTSRRFVEKAQLAPRTEMVMLEDVAAAITRWQKARAWLTNFLLPAAVLRRLYSRHGLRPDDPATVIFTSGSTGPPKGVVQSHKNIAANIVGFCQILSFESDDCLCGVLPFFHSFGFTATLWAPVLRNFRVVYHANPLDARTIGRLIREHRATHLIATPTFLQVYARKCEPNDLRTLRVVICGAEKMRPQVADRFERTFGIRPLEGYGCTELSPVAAVNIPGEPPEEGAREGTIGQALPNVAAKVVDPETGEPLPPGEEGLLLIKGPNVMVGYLDDPDATEAVMEGDWYRTGDIARIDEDGFITVTGRLSRFSKIAGEMVPHMALEDAIHDVAELDPSEPRCVVTSVPDERKGERLVVLHTDLGIDVGELIDRLRGGDLPNLWVPGPDQFHQVDEIPLLASGKLDLKQIRRIAAEASRQ